MLIYSVHCSRVSESTLYHFGASGLLHVLSATECALAFVVILQNHNYPLMFCNTITLEFLSREISVTVYTM